jgi:hypothetical protein
MKTTPSMTSHEAEPLLRAMSDAAFTLIKVIEREHAGIRGDGMGVVVDDLIAAINAWVELRGGKPAWRFELVPPGRGRPDAW